MELEKLQIGLKDDPPKDHSDRDYLGRFEYNDVLDTGSGVFFKVDWSTIMFKNVNINCILRWLHLDEFCDDFFNSLYELHQGYEEKFRFSYNGIIFDCSKMVLCDELFDICCPIIRVEISGKGLDFLRSLGFDMNVERFVPPTLPIGGSYHFSRIDYAFDLVNYKPEFLDQLIDFCNTNHLPSGRVPLANSGGAVSCKVVTCNQKTVYLGSTQSDRMLRVYDKRMQQSDLSLGVYKEVNPYNNPANWIRIELQLRNKRAHGSVTDLRQDAVSIMGNIFHDFAFADASFDNRRGVRPVVDFWNQLFDWNELKFMIIQNANYVLLKSAKERLSDWMDNVGYAKVFDYISTFGIRAFFSGLRKYIFGLYGHDERSCKKLLKRINVLRELDADIPIDPPKGFFGIFVSSGRFNLRIPKDLDEV